MFIAYIYLLFAGVQPTGPIGPGAIAGECMHVCVLLVYWNDCLG